jgi:hypothetical protein
LVSATVTAVALTLAHVSYGVVPTASVLAVGTHIPTRAPLPLAEIFNFNSGLGITASNAGRGAQIVQAQVPDATNSQLFVWSPCAFQVGVGQRCPGN